MKNKLHIFTEATGIYNRYLDELIDSIFYPLKSNFKDFDIDINIISDKDYFSENDEYNEFIKNYHIVNMPYPCTAMFKFLYIYDCYVLFEYDMNDKFIFIDADSYFIKEANYEEIVNDINNYDLLFSATPWSFDYINPGYSYNISVGENPLFFSTGFRENPVINNFIQSSFIISSGLYLKQLNNIIYNWLAYDLNNTPKHRYIPEFSDQAYINKFLDRQLNNNQILIPDCKIKVGKYIFNDYNELYKKDINKYKEEISNKISDTIFVIQKSKSSLKQSKRNNPGFSVNI